MSRTTILDDATASDIDEQRHSQPVQFIKRGTAPFMRVTLALFPRAWRLSRSFIASSLYYRYFPGVWRLPRQQQRFTFYFYRHAGYRLTFTGPLSDAIGRKPVMVTALLLASCCTLLSTMMTSWHGILIMRALIGLSLSGVAAVGMTYLSEEIHPSFVAFSMGLYISGNSIGGMSGRLLSGVMTDFLTGASRWRPSDALRWRPR